MLFNSPEFLVFFVVVLGVYWALGHKWQNYFLLLASYIFYGSWNWKFLSLILLSTIIDYYCGQKIFRASAQATKRRFLLLSLVTNLGILGYFKYFGFFIDEFVDLLATVGIPASSPALNIILPLGISFYTFQTLSYTIDIYRGKMEPTASFTNFALFVAFFPQLAAGPIERARHLLPQIEAKRRFDYDNVIYGMQLICLGLFMKVVIADRIGTCVDMVYGTSEIDGTPESFDGAVLLAATYLFAFQIYFDFCGYSTIARGVGKTLGIELSFNFRLPYYSKTPVEFWQRWHISLSEWFRDYLYYPLAMYYVRKARGFLNQYKAHFIAMTLIGLWHGASWNFVFFGMYWGLVIVGYSWWRPAWEKVQDRFAGMIESKGAKRPLRFALTITKIVLLFHVTCIGWILFRAQTLTDAWTVLSRAPRGVLGVVAVPDILKTFGVSWTHLVALPIVVAFVECALYVEDRYQIKHWFPSLPIWIRWPIYAVVITAITIFGISGERPFIYFVF